MRRGKKWEVDKWDPCQIRNYPHSMPHQPDRRVPSIDQEDGRIEGDFFFD